MAKTIRKSCEHNNRLNGAGLRPATASIDFRAHFSARAGDEGPEPVRAGDDRLCSAAHGHSLANRLQVGLTQEIKVYPKDIEAGNMISPDLFLKDAPFGITQIDYKEMGRVIQAAKAGGNR